MLYSAYDKKEPTYSRTESGVIVPWTIHPPKQLKGFDFFAGCGGFSLGMHQAGIHVVGACEFDCDAAITYMHNLANYGQLKMHFDTPEREAQMEKKLSKMIKVKNGVVTGPMAGTGWIRENPGPGCEHFWIADIRNLTGAQILKELKIEKGELDVICGGPPCQGFSRAGKQDVYDPRNALVFEFARMIVEMAPKTFVFENVPGILNMTTPEGVPIMDEFCSIIADGDYASYESTRKMLGLKAGSRRVVRAQIKKEKKQKKAKPVAPKVTGAEMLGIQQQSLF